MPRRFNYCPFCKNKIEFTIQKTDIDNSRYPAPVYIEHDDPECGKIATFYVDSLLRISYKETEKKPGAIKTIKASSR